MKLPHPSSEDSPESPHTARPNHDSDLEKIVAFCSEHGAHLEPQSPHGWLVRTKPESNGVVSLLGCIEEQGDHVELMQLCDGTFSWATFDTLSLAVTYLLTSSIEAAAEDLAELDSVDRVQIEPPRGNSMTTRGESVAHLHQPTLRADPPPLASKTVNGRVAHDQTSVLEEWIASVTSSVDLITTLRIRRGV